jgi:1-acyl-sn-glycerol-3-phosphate acyltransferase
LDKPIRFWGAHEMNSGLVKMYKYQTRVYYHEKKHWNLHLARLFCLIASPLTNLFYAGLDLISTYKDTRFKKTINESLEAVKNGQSIVVFPEDSKNGYLAELEGFYAGFVLFAEACKRQGIDIPIYVSYFKKEEKIYVIDKPVLYSELVAEYGDKKQIADKLRLRCNELGKMQFDAENNEN